MHVSKQRQACDKCAKDIQKSNFAKHYASCGIKKATAFSCDSWYNGEHWKCPDCGFVAKTRQSATSHYWRLHTNTNIRFNPPTNSNGRHNSWNKGLTKETDLRVANNALASGNALKGRKGTPPSEQNRRNTSIRMSLNNPGGKSKWYEVAGQKLQGTWERNIAIKLEELGIRWYKAKVNKDVWRYELDGKTRSYLILLISTLLIWTYILRSKVIGGVMIEPRWPL
jgi:hypothetical protein